MHTSEVSILHEKKKKIQEKQPTTSKANAQESCSFKSHNMGHKGFYSILGEICCVILRCCFEVEETPLLQA